MTVSTEIYFKDRNIYLDVAKRGEHTYLYSNITNITISLNHMNNNFKGKSIIIGLPKNWQLDKVLIKELTNLGFDSITDVSYLYSGYKYTSFFQRVQSFYIKNFANRPDYKRLLAFKSVESEYIEKLNNIPNADYAFLIRPDIYSSQFIDMIGTKAKKTVGYQWDGLKRFPAIQPLIRKFNRFFVFDTSDLNQCNVMPLTNFGVMSYKPESLYDESRKSDVYFSGSFYPERVDVLSRLLSQLSSLGLKVNYILSSNKPRNWKDPNLNITSNTVTFEENLKNTFNAKIILDLVIEEHQGLSFRVFEALTFDKKLITTNKSVMHYDFYDPSNIFVWTNASTKKELDKFVNSPIKPVCKHLKYKYSFENWLKYALNEGDFIPIDLPTE